MEFIAIENHVLSLVCLKREDYDALFEVASNKEIWAQHPHSDRYLPTGFQAYFDSLLRCDIAYLVVNKNTRNIIGATGYYNFDKDKKTITIGYTFLTPAYWGTGMNASLKSLMINHAFQYVDAIIFHAGAQNFRSQKAIQKLGAIKTGETQNQTNPPTSNFEYTLLKTKI